MTAERVIGAGGKLPWHLPADLRRFRAITLGHPILMGRRTFESIGRPLPGRTNIVLTRDRQWSAEGCLIAHRLEEALTMAAAIGEVMVVGGAGLYALSLPPAGRIYLTEVHAELAGDVWFPDYDREEWREVERTDHPTDPANRHPYSFVVLERRGLASQPQT
jgi:dihydrofolate reductase